MDRRKIETIETIAAEALDEVIGERQPGIEEMPAQVLADPASVDFGTARVGTTATESVTLSNPTGIALTVIDVTFSRPCFELVSTLPLEIPGKSEAPLAIEFRPLAPGLCSGEMVLEIDAAGGRFRKVPVRGYGVS